MSARKQYYFMHNGKRYEPGTILKIKPYCKAEELYFEWYVPESDLYVFEYIGPHGRVGVGMRGTELQQYLICVTDEVDQCVARKHAMRMENNKLTFTKELEIDGMLIAWLWYIVLMAVTLLFNGFYFYWAIISFCFFIYRYGKLVEEGYK